MITDVTEPTALKAMVEELRTKLGNIKKLEGNDLTTKVRIGWKLRNEAGITDENIYFAVLDELMK